MTPVSTDEAFHQAVTQLLALHLRFATLLVGGDADIVQHVEHLRYQLAQGSQRERALVAGPRAAAAGVGQTS